MANAGLRHTSLPAAAWVGGAVLGGCFLACLVALICVQSHLETLQVELAWMKGELMSKMQGKRGDQGTPKLHQRTADLGAPSALKGRPSINLERRKREAGHLHQEKPRQRRKQSILHLVPVRQSNTREKDATEIWWKPFLQQGRALEPSGRDIAVKNGGLYFIYNQVLFHDPTFTMGQVLWRIVPGQQDQILFRCVQSMPPNPEQSYNTCYSGGIFHLQHGDRLHLLIPRFNASFDISPHGTFLGLLRL